MSSASTSDPIDEVVNENSVVDSFNINEYSYRIFTYIYINGWSAVEINAMTKNVYECKSPSRLTYQVSQTSGLGKILETHAVIFENESSKKSQNIFVELSLMNENENRSSL